VSCKRSALAALAVLAAVSCEDAVLVGDEPNATARPAGVGFAGRAASASTFADASLSMPAISTDGGPAQAAPASMSCSAACPQLSASLDTLHCVPPPDPSCLVAPGFLLPSEVTVDVQGATTHYFAGGASLPRGRYRVAYVDGCLTAGTTALGLGVGWSVHGTKKMLGVMSCYLVSDSGTPITFTPGSVGAFVGPDLDAGQGAAPTYNDCIVANCGAATPVDFDFPGGRLGVARDGGTVLGAIDDLGRESVGGRSPTFRLTSLDGTCL
jgi:hypothetical protein